MHRKTGLVWNERFMWHDQGRYAGILPAEFPLQQGYHHEHPETKRRLKNLLDACDMTEKLLPIKARPISREELLRVHTPGYLDRLEAGNLEHAASAGFDAPYTRGSVDIAKLAAGGCLAAVDAIFNKEVDNAYALVRPIGHHAEPDEGKGFCLFSNAALAARHAQQVHGIRRVALIDIDVHHGNGAERTFYDDPDVLTLSLHQAQWFPADSGFIADNGHGPGEGYNINVPLPAGSGFGAYKDAFERVVLPALERFEPEFVIIPCGYDAGAQDPLGRMILNGGAFRWITRSLREVAERFAQGRLLVTHEGGYNPFTVAFMGLAVFEELSGIDTGVVDPHEDIFAAMHGHALLDHQREVVDACAELVERVGRPGQGGAAWRS